MPNNQDRATKPHEDMSAHVATCDADATTIRAIHDRLATMRAGLMRQTWETEKMMDWLARKKA